MPQILFSRNELYYSDYFRRDLWQRRAWRMLAEHELKAWLAGRSLGAASHHVVPTAAMSAHLRKAGVLSDAIAVLPFGFDPEIFTQSKEPLAAEQLAKLQSTPTASKILYVSHYNYFRNFETLLRALPLIKEKIGRPVQLVLTTELRRDGNYGGYDATRDVELIERLKLTDDLVMLGAVAYRQLHEVYRACDLFACPSYAESFGHPLLEAMANDLPVIAANLPVHREICQNAATYFDVFDETELAIRVAEVLKDEPLRKRLVEAGRQRVKEFSWDAHVEGLMQLMDEVLSAA
ncbi:MAG: glycosyltransferase [Acidobacteria bacterium]|nr:glycosyltransferase [Acidobacteriota bacterium]